MSGVSASVESPCIGVCVLDDNDICEGCCRSAREIAAWTSMSDQEKQRVVELSWQRARKAGKLL